MTTLATPLNPDPKDAFKTGTALAWDFNGSIYALYGAATGDSRRGFYRYNISSDSWQPLANATVDQGEGDALTWVGRPYNRVYATIGGEQRPTYFMYYDPTTDTWSDEPADPPAGMGDGASLVWTGGDYIYALRGEYSEEEPLYDFWRYSISQNTWVSMDDIPAYPHDGGIGYYVGCRLGYADGHIYAWQGTPSTWDGGGDDLAMYVFPSPPTVQPPLFKVLEKDTCIFDGGVNVSITFMNYGFNATEGSVWMPWDRAAYCVPFVGSKAGNLSERLAAFDVNGDGDISDVFTVQCVDNETVEINGVVAKAMVHPEGRIYYDSVGRYDIMEKNSFQLGKRNNTLYGVSYWTRYGFGSATFGLNTTFINHPSPNLMLIVEQPGSSINSTSNAEIVYAEVNGTEVQPNFCWASSYIAPEWISAHDIGPWRWVTDNISLYPLGFLGQNATFNIKISIRRKPGTYELFSILNWSPDGEKRYRYIVYDAAETPFAIAGMVHKSVKVGVKTYPIEINTNSTISEKIIFNSPLKEILFNATSYGGLTSFWNVTIPQSILKGEPWTVMIDGKPIVYTRKANETHTFLYFTYEYPSGLFQTSTISIIGTWAQAENATLTINTTMGGTTEPSPGIYTYPTGSYVDVTATLNLGYSFDHWLLDGEKRFENPISIFMDSNHTLEAYFVDDVKPEMSEPWQYPPADNVQPFQNVTVWINVTDYGSGIKNVTLWYSLNNGTSWTILNMTALPIPSDQTITYEATIRGYENCTWITYKIVAYDNAGNNATKDNNGYSYKYHVIPEFPSPLILPMFILNALIANVLLKKKRKAGCGNSSGDERLMFYGGNRREINH